MTLLVADVTVRRMTNSTNDRLTEVEYQLSELKREFADLQRLVSALLTKGPDDLEGADAELYESLREWRRERCERDGLQLFQVFSNKLLAAIASVRPADRFELSRIKGIGDDKVTKFGDDVLAIVAGEQPW